PARYFGVRDRPIEITLRGTEEMEAAGWHRILEDTLGELTIRVLARRGLTEDRARGVADGWGGDRLRALVRGDELLLVWVTSWAPRASSGRPARSPGSSGRDVPPTWCCSTGTSSAPSRRTRACSAASSRASNVRGWCRPTPQRSTGRSSVWRGRAAAAGSSSA